jgi:hypothetical protein
MMGRRLGNRPREVMVRTKQVGRGHMSGLSGDGLGWGLGEDMVGWSEVKASVDAETHRVC